MAKKDLYDWFKLMQQDYNEMQHIVDKANKDVENGLMTNEQREQFLSYYNDVITNYQRTRDIVHLVMLPPKFIQNWRQRKLDKQQLKEYKKKQKEAKKSFDETREENRAAIRGAQELYDSLPEHAEDEDNDK